MEKFELINESRIVEEAKKGQFTNSILTILVTGKWKQKKLNFNRIIQEI